MSLFSEETCTCGQVFLLYLGWPGEWRTVKDEEHSENTRLLAEAEGFGFIDLQKGGEYSNCGKEINFL